MSDINSLIEVFRMTEVPVDVRIKIIKQLGWAINDEYCRNLTEPLVYSLVTALDPDNDIKYDEQYTGKKYIKFDLMDNFNRLFKVVQKEFGALDVEIALAEIDDPDDTCLGQTDFERKLILIHHDQTPTQMIDIIAHELAHFICGFEADHNEEWKKTYEKIYSLYQEESLKLKEADGV